jgi:predicted TIM-barrel fold metal-dependent hydrolase
MVEEIARDVGGGHNITHTVYMQSNSAGWVRSDGPAEFMPVGESEFVQGVAVMGESGRFGTCRLGAGIVGTVDLSLGAEIIEPVLQEHQRVARNFLGGKAESIKFDDPSILSSLRVLERMGLTFDCNGPETHPLDFRGVLGGLCTVAKACPSLKVIVDHCGGAVGPATFADASKREEWETCMAELAALPNVYIKVGGLQMQVNGFPLGPSDRQAGPVTSDELLELTSELYGHVIRLFGPHRCMFESNFPGEVVVHNPDSCIHFEKLCMIA